MPPLFSLFLLLGLLLGPVLQAQNGLCFDRSLSLSSAEQITCRANGQPLTLRLQGGQSLTLMPPDMARLNQARIRSLRTDTLPSHQGPDRCISTAELDTFFVSEDFFLLDVIVEVPFSADGTFEGQSRLGWELLRQAGNCQGPRQTDSGPVTLTVKDIQARNLTLSARYEYLKQLDPTEQAGFAIQPGDLAEIRLIRGNDQSQARARLALMQQLLEQQPIFCQAPSIDPALPPDKALKRLSSPVTIRYFEAKHAPRAQALSEAIQFLFALPTQDLQVEDMQAAYGGTVPVADYLEVWFQ